MNWLAIALARAAEGQLKAIAAEAFPKMSLDAAQAEVSKYLGGGRGQSAFRVVEAVLKLGRREMLRQDFDRALRDTRAEDVVERVEQLNHQIELFGGNVIALRREVQLLLDRGELLPLKQKT